MVCATSCLLSTVFIISMIYFYNATNKSEIVKTYKEKLSPELREKYEKITKERLQISYKGYLLGFVLSMLIILYNVYFKQGKAFDIFSMICIVISTSFITNYFYYILSPKTDMMVNHLKTKEEIQAWSAMYKEMQYNYHMGLALGIAAVGIMAFAFRC